MGLRRKTDWKNSKEEKYRQSQANGKKHRREINETQKKRKTDKEKDGKNYRLGNKQRSGKTGEKDTEGRTEKKIKIDEKVRHWKNDTQRRRKGRERQKG